MSWSIGLKKVDLTKLIREAAGLPLDQAHDIVNRLLAGNVVEIAVPTADGARRFAREAQTLGAAAEYLETEIPA